MSDKEKFEKDLASYRVKINEIDDKLINLLNERANLVLEIGNVKKQLNIDVIQPQREAEIFQRLKSKSTIFTSSSIEAIWKEIISASRVIQDSIAKVGYLGPLGTFTHQAALEFFPKAGSEFISFNNSFEICEGIEKGIIEYGVLPIENSLQGTVRETIDLLIEKDLVIYGEIEIRITQNLISHEKANLSDIKNVFSHPQAFAQTRNWLKANIPNANLIEVSSTAEAARRVKKLEDPSYAAIGTRFASEVYDLQVLKEKVEDESSNFTRFLIISTKENPQKQENMKTSIVFVTKHVPGALYWVLKIFTEAKINLTKIESRPRRRVRWEYIFFVDFEGEKMDPNVQEALSLMQNNVIWMKILGSYPSK